MGNRRALSHIAVALLCLLAFASTVAAQPQRYELGRRMRVFEMEWEKVPGAAARKNCVAFLQQAVTAFFTARFGEGGRALDQARFALDDNSKPTPARRWAESLALFPGGRLLSADHREIAWELKPFYVEPKPVAGEFVLHLALVIQGNVLFQQTVPIKDLPMKGKLEVKDIPEGDHLLRYEILHDKESLARGTMQLSIVNNLAKRLGQLKERLLESDSELATERATMQATVRLIEKLAGGDTEETDYPAASLLREAEAVHKSVQARTKFYTRERAGQHWLSLVVRPDPKDKERVVRLRVLVPERWNEKNPPPLVIALHGAGGSENLFFDGYGNGKIVRLCQERGWMLVAPRVEFRLPLAAILDELHGRYPFDRSQILLIGHSMGAATAVQAVSLDPRRYAGLVVLGGSGTFKASDDLKKVPVFICVGAQDFALGGARGLKDRLVKAGLKTVTMRELPDVEHLGVVQQSLGEAFAFFDQVVKRP